MQKYNPEYMHCFKNLNANYIMTLLFLGDLQDII